ncbi:MAG: c(7)-type cytochrome triheme domain-containing protein [Thermodesulfobacteriota bacterium]
MNKKRIFNFVAFVAVFTLIILFGVVIEQAVSSDITDRTKVKSPDDYGTILLNNKTGPGGPMPAVSFPHWWHRSQFTCKVCHTDIGFPMKAGETDFAMEQIFAGKQCGNCHNGTVAFAAMECNRCHSGGKPVDGNRNIAETFPDLPKSGFGNKIDWVKALRQGKIKPKASIDGSGEMMVVDMDIVIPVTKFKPHPPDVVYPHKAHTELMDCSSCHTDIFQMQKGGNPEMNMMKIMSGQYCGVCHGKVAFPLENCFRCHSKDPAVVEEWK